MTMISKILVWLKMIKPDWTNQPPTDDDKALVKRIINEETSELFDAMANDDITEIKDAVIDIIWVALNAAALYDIKVGDMEEYADKVLESNWSKLCMSESEAAKTVIAYRLGVHPDKLGVEISTYYVQIDITYYVVLRSADNKIMKSINYKPVNTL